jgi:hypothetical protein
MTLPELTYLVSVLNQLVDGGHHVGVTIDEVEDRIDRVALFPWLRNRFADHIGFHLSIYDRDRATLDEIEYGLFDILGGYRGQERRKFGIEHNGICLLISWLCELMQRSARQDQHAIADIAN